MRTSATQFQLLVEYMEKYGDLSKPSEGPQGRIINSQRWNQLTELLNSDATGDTKTAEKWRKVWSDFKNNTKRKASRIHRSAQRTGGGPACKLKLSDIEERVLRILGTQAATGIETIAEVGLEEETITQLPPDLPSQASQPQQEIYLAHEDWNRPSSSTELPIFQPAHSASIEEPRLVVERGVPPEDAHIGTDPHVNRSEIGPANIGVPPENRALHDPHVNRSEIGPANIGVPPENRASQSPTPLPFTPRRQRRGRLQHTNSPIRRRTRTQTQSELARQAFVRSDSEWRAFQQEAERERIRVRELELRMQERWIDLFGQFLEVFRNIADNLGNR